MADIINSVDRSLDMYIYDLYIYRYLCCVSPTMRCGRLPSRSDVNMLKDIHSSIASVLMRAEMHLRHLATMVLPLEAFVSPVAAWSLLPRSNVLVTKLYQDGNRSDFVQLLHVRMPGSRMVEFQGQFFMSAFNKGVLQSSSSDSTIWKRDAFGINSTSKFWTS